MSRQTHILRLPSEVLHNVFTECYPADLKAAALCCQTFNAYISHNKTLCKDLYLKSFDNPPVEYVEQSLDWEEELHSAIRLKKLLASGNTGIKTAEFRTIASSVEKLLRSSAAPSHDNRKPVSRNVLELIQAFRLKANYESLLHRSTLFSRAGYSVDWVEGMAELRQLSAKLHVLYGVCDHPEEDGVRPLVTVARANVYDLRNYTDGSFWGPYLDNGLADADWEKLESIMVVLCYNLRRFHETTEKRFPLIWHNHFAGVAPKSFLSPPREVPSEGPRSELERMDPYNITGTWMRVVCFLDYSDLYTYNFTSTPPNGGSRPPLAVEEAIRIISMKLEVVKLEKGDEEDGGYVIEGADRKAEECFPIVHFVGKSRSMHAGWDPNANSSIRVKGTVRMTREKEVRWTTFSVFHGEERWRSEGIQVGGIQSARGVWGTWHDKDFDPQGPCGPTAFWKIHDDLPDEAKEHGVAHAQRQQRSQRPYAGDNSAEAYLANVTAYGMNGFVTQPNVSDGGSMNLHLHPYMQTVDDDDEDATAVTGLVLGAAGESMPIVDDILDQ